MGGLYGREEYKPHDQLVSCSVTPNGTWTSLKETERTNSGSQVFFRFSSLRHLVLFVCRPQHDTLLSIILLFSKPLLGNPMLAYVIGIHWHPHQQQTQKLKLPVFLFIFVVERCVSANEWMRTRGMHPYKRSSFVFIRSLVGERREKTSSRERGSQNLSLLSSCLLFLTWYALYRLYRNLKRLTDICSASICFFL